MERTSKTRADARRIKEGEAGMRRRKRDRTLSAMPARGSDRSRRRWMQSEMKEGMTGKRGRGEGNGREGRRGRRKPGASEKLQALFRFSRVRSGEEPEAGAYDTSRLHCHVISVH
jgi:hypothetical protein